MPQWIKIQSLLEINNTQNIQRILQCFTVRVLKTFQWQHTSKMYRSLRHKWPTEDWGQSHTQMPPCVFDFHLNIKSNVSMCGDRQGKELFESIRMHSRLTCVACYDAASLHTSRGRNRKHSWPSFLSILPLITDWEVCTKKAGNFLIYLPFFFPTI